MRIREGLCKLLTAYGIAHARAATRTRWCYWMFCCCLPGSERSNAHAVVDLEEALAFVSGVGLFVPFLTA